MKNILCAILGAVILLNVMAFAARSLSTTAFAADPAPARQEDRVAQLESEVNRLHKEVADFKDQAQSANSYRHMSISEDENSIHVYGGPLIGSGESGEVAR
jgi:peptidoglycan hydrolase CwlO-like protein